MSAEAEVPMIWLPLIFETISGSLFPHTVRLRTIAPLASSLLKNLEMESFIILAGRC